VKELEQLGYSNINPLNTYGEGKLYTCEKQGIRYMAKVLNQLDEDQVGMLNQINALQSPYFPHIIDIINSANQTVIIQEFITGTTLKDEIRKNGSYNYYRAKKIIYDICNALRVLHHLKPHPVIYCDLSPNKVMITANGDVRLVDFGFAHRDKQESAHETLMASNSCYCAPEVVDGLQSDVRSDIYSIGIIFYELLSGNSLQQPPYKIRPLAENNEYLPKCLDDIIAKATDINQVNRYASIEELVDALEKIQHKKKPQKKKISRFYILAALSLVFILIIDTVFLLPNLKKGKDAIVEERYETLLELNFEDESELSYFIGGDLQVKDGRMDVLGWSNLDALISSGTIVHIRGQLPTKIGEQDSFFELQHKGQNGIFTEYRVGNTCTFQAFYQTDESSQTTWYQKLSGTPVANHEQMLDIILYTNPDNSAIYAFIYDSESEGLGYIAYQIPGYMDNNPKYTLSAATELPEGSNENISIDYLNLSEGSLRQYLKDHIPAYDKHENRLDDLLSTKVRQLPEMVLKEGGDW